MTFDAFDKFAEGVIAQVLTMRDTKGREYAGAADRFGNFNRLADRMGITRQQVWQVYATKHMDSIETFIREGQTYSTESIQGRIVDEITYLLLLAGMVEEDRQCVEAQTKLAQTIEIGSTGNTDSLSSISIVGSFTSAPSPAQTR